MGYSNDVEINGKKVHLSLTANPSHLEAVNCVVTGKVRAKQDRKSDADRSRVMGVLLHGDAAFAGQGSVAEGLVLSDLDGYRTGGTVHIIINNQIGFTTDPKKSRSSPYPSDVAKMIGAPIFHVNGDNPEAVLFVAQLAAEYRQQFKKDVVLDIVCYRRYGHNEGDEPMFTQPQMYKKIAGLPRPREVYANRLIAEGAITSEAAADKVQKFKDYLEEQFKIGKDYKPNKADMLEGVWEGFEKVGRDANPTPDTGFDAKKLKEIGLAISAIPSGFNANSKIVTLMNAKKKMFETGEGIDWATAEALAFGSLQAEGIPVRLSGQDCGRGTFSHRHSVLIDQENESTYQPLNNIGAKAKYEVVDSAISEFAVLAFDYGYSLADPMALTIWEAQFGDFSNGAQVIIDQFISSGEAKWLRMSGLVMLLPHGYEGQGPEHSSARLERYLQLCAEDNMQVANVTTAANYFHILRRQIKRNFRKPLVMMSPKSLLRKKEVFSNIADFAPGTKFKRVIGEEAKLVADDKVRKVVICSGKVYYDIAEKRDAAKINDVAIIRLEQLYPFPKAEVLKELGRYKNADVVWCQEEPKNMGGWLFARAFIDEAIESQGGKKRVTYAGRISAASPATGFYKVHNKEQDDLVAAALA
jgi:2-oxoglutarate dehydrogenase E1 component